MPTDFGGWLAREGGWLTREERYAMRAMGVAFGAGLLLAAMTSGGILGERLSAGNVRVALLANIVASLAAVIVFVVTIRARATAFARPAGAGERASTASRASGSPGSSVHQVLRLRSLVLLGPQVIGAACGVALVHIAVQASSFGGARFLVEAPAQYVNDAVAILAILTVNWGVTSRRMASLWIVAGVGLVLLYAATHARWHLDTLPFAITVQELVVAQFFGAAIGVAVFRRLAVPDDEVA